MNSIKQAFQALAAGSYLQVGLIGLFGGIASGLFGVGGGIVMVPAMIFLLAMDPRVAIGSSLIVIIPTAIMGSFKHYLQGNIDWKIAFSLMPMAILGGYTGAWLTSFISSDNLKRTFGAFLILVGLRLLIFK
jgi:hypothetical protein